MASISVIIPVYNVSSYIKRTIDSVVNQTFKDIEIIVVDDGSTDDSLTIVQKFVRQDKRIVVKSTSNLGVVNARKLGLSIASSPYIFYLDGDDFLEAEALELLYKKAKEEDADMVFFDYREYSEAKQEFISHSVFWEELSPIEWLMKAYTFRIRWSVWIYLHKKHLYKEIDFDILDNISIGEDAILTSALVSYSKKIVKLNECLMTYVVRKDSITQTANLSETAYNSYYLFPERIYEFFKEKASSQSLEAYINNLYILVVKQTLFRERYDKAPLFCKRAKVALRNFPELEVGLNRRVVKLIKLFSISSVIGQWYLKKCIRKDEQKTFLL